MCWDRRNMGTIRHYGTARMTLQADGAPQGTVITYFFRVESEGNPDDMEPEARDDFTKRVEGIILRQQSLALAGGSRLVIKRTFEALVEAYPDRHIIAEGIDMYMENTAIGAEVRAVIREDEMKPGLRELIKDYMMATIKEDIIARKPYVKLVLDEMDKEGTLPDELREILESWETG